MLVLVEGPENAGKTAWCRKFQDLWPYTSLLVHHMPGSSDVDTINRELVAFARLPQEWAILFDRWFYSDYVYKPLLGLDLEMAIPVEEAKESFGAADDFRVLLLPTIEVLKSRAAADDSGVDKALEVQAYLDLYGDWPRNVTAEVVVQHLRDLIDADILIYKAAEVAMDARNLRLDKLAELGKVAPAVVPPADSKVDPTQGAKPGE